MKLKTLNEKSKKRRKNFVVLKIFVFKMRGYKQYAKSI